MRRLWAIVLCLPACAGPSQAEMDAHVEEARRIQAAGAVHMPPAGVDSCVGITVRLTEDTPGSQRDRQELIGRITEAEVDAALRKAGAPRCAEAFREEALAQGLTNEPLRVKSGYAIDPNGRVCAVVERSRMDPIDPAAVPLLDLAAGCLKDALFRAQFPAGRVVDQERVVRFSSIDLTMVETVTSTSARR